ncbi:proteasome assembly chaperone family protein [Natronobiforma cellulositropha]|uniref:proteasome assembly chaperone family protein n=1 Tax=Natronobiforma cellulositropha TaxID=1679076 RepID=UPI0021D5C2A7|nr:proteasome assembly chaperone family protein [Natronobiforma cellulositropha]
MAQIRIQGEPIGFENPTLLEGFPGIGLVGKIATDHLIDELEMDYYASVHCEGLPRVGVYRTGDPTVRPPVRIYADEESELLALQSDTPIAAQAVANVSACLSSWMIDHGIRPVFLSGFPSERDGEPDLYGVATGAGSGLLDAHDIADPPEDGVVAGPTGALINRAAELGLDSVGLVVDADPQFPDPEAARVLIEEGIAPLTGLEVDVTDLVERAGDIRTQREQLAKRMRDAGEQESSQAKPLRMYQ